MKFNILNIFKSASVLAVASFLTGSCANVGEDMTGVVGYLCPPALEVDLTIEDLISTKALDGFTVEEPNLADFRYVVKDKDNVVKYDGTGLWEPLTMPVGPYSVVATLGDNGFGAPSFYGATDPDAYIDAVQQVEPQMTIQIRNAVVRVSVDSDFAKHFTLNSVVLTSGEGEDKDSRTLSASEISSWYFVPSDQPLEIRLIGQSSAGVPKEFTHTITPEKRSANDIICNQFGSNVPVITLPDQTSGAWATRLYVTPATFENVSYANQAQVKYEILKDGVWEEADVIKPAEEGDPSYQVFKDLVNGQSYTVRARVGNLKSIEVSVEIKEGLPGATIGLTHTYPGNVLTGTDASFSVNLGANDTDILNVLYSKKLLAVTSTLKRNGTSVRTSSALSGTMDDQNSGWPYLPKGKDYEFTVGLRTTGDSADVPAFTKSEVESVAPSFSISLTSYSSYDKYLEYKAGNTDALGVANSTDALTIKNMGVTWTIAENLMDNGNYSKNLTFQGASAPAAGASYITSDVTGRTVGEDYGVSAKLVFDGVEATASKNHYITGLPYKYDFYDTQSIPDDWTSYGTKWENTLATTKLLISRNGSEGYLISPKFCFTGTAAYIVEAQYYRAGVGMKADMYVGASASHTAKATSYNTHTIGSNVYTTEDRKEVSGSLTISSSLPYVSISHNGANPSLTDYLVVYSFALNYQ